MIQTRYSKLKTKESHQDIETYKGIWRSEERFSRNAETDL